MDYADDIASASAASRRCRKPIARSATRSATCWGISRTTGGSTRTALEPAGLHEIDRWALGQLNGVVRDVRAAYEQFEFYRVYQRIYQFCAVELSSFYLDVLKDRLYAESPDGPDRRAAQFVLGRLHDHLTRLLAPIIPHTAEESWDYRPAGPESRSSVHLTDFPEPEPRWDDPARDCALGRADPPPRANPFRTGRPEEDEADRQRPGGQGPDHDQPSRPLAARSRAAGDALHRLGRRDRRRSFGGRRDGASRAVVLCQMRTVLELSVRSRPGRRAPDSLRAVRQGDLGMEFSSWLNPSV